MTKEKIKVNVKPWNVDEAIKTLLNSKRTTKDYQIFKKELLQNNYYKETADVYIKCLKKDWSSIIRHNK